MDKIEQKSIAEIKLSLQQAFSIFECYQNGGDITNLQSLSRQLSHALKVTNELSGAVAVKNKMSRPLYYPMATKCTGGMAVMEFVDFPDFRQLIDPEMSLVDNAQRFLAYIMEKLHKERRIIPLPSLIIQKLNSHIPAPVYFTAGTVQWHNAGVEAFNNQPN
jgi:hypothetical protein